MKKMKTTSYELNMIRPELVPGRVRLAFLTDLHNVENGPQNADLIRAVKEAAPDLILCGGDMIVAKSGHPTTVSENLLLELAKDYPVFYALGNHEGRHKTYVHQYGDIYQEYKKRLTDNGVTFLENASELISVRGLPLQIFGYELPMKFYKRTKRSELDLSEVQEAIGNPNKSAINILIAHHPGHMETYSNWGAEMILCGHYHGGILRLGEHSGLITPNLKLFSSSCYGYFNFHAREVNGQIIPQDQHIIISAGLGEHTIPLRINNPRELVIIDLCTNMDDELQ